jgi:hypothetical protein
VKGVILHHVAPGGGSEDQHFHCFFTLAALTAAAMPLPTPKGMLRQAQSKRWG